MEGRAFGRRGEMRELLIWRSGADRNQVGLGPPVAAWGRFYGTGGGEEPSLCTLRASCAGGLTPSVGWAGVPGGQGSLHGHTWGSHVPGHSPAGTDPHFCLSANALAQEQTEKQGTNRAKYAPALAICIALAQESVVYGRRFI